MESPASCGAFSSSAVNAPGSDNTLMLRLPGGGWPYLRGRRTGERL